MDDTNTTIDMDMKNYIKAILDEEIILSADTAAYSVNAALKIVRIYLSKSPKKTLLDMGKPTKEFTDRVLSLFINNAIDPSQRMTELEEHQRKAMNRGGPATIPPHMMVQLIIEYSLSAIIYEANQCFSTSWTYASNAMYWAGYLFGSASLPPRIPSTTHFAKLGAMARHASDPKQQEKAMVKQHWENWQAKPYLYKTQIAFALDMCEKHKNLDSPETIKRWVRTWEKENKSNKS